MKVVSIGRGTDCQVVLDEPTISRRHAILKIYPWGKMELVDMGQNGTFVNGVKLSSNVPYPVTRKDVISFAHVRQLDWNLIPDPLRYFRWATWAVLGTALLIGGFIFIESLGKKEAPVQPEEVPVATQPADNPTNNVPSQEDAKGEVEKNKKYKTPEKLQDLPTKKKKKEKVKEEEKKQEDPKPVEKPKENNPVYL